MRRRSGFRNAVEYALAVAVLKSLQWTPLGFAYQLAAVYTRLLDRAVPRLRRIALFNLSMALPELGPRRHAEIADGVFRSIARLLVSFARLPSLRKENLDRWIRWEGAEHYEEALRRGRGVLFATGHLGNWELSAYAHAILSEPMNVVVRPLDNPWLDRLVERRRAGSGNCPIYKKDFARGILKALAANGAVGILIDQNAAGEGSVFVDFFGMRAATGTGFVKLAAHSGATVIPGFALWSGEEQRYVLRFYPPVAMSGDAERDTQALQAALEAIIRAHPDQWLWIHRRWKTRPPGEAPLYPLQ
jgi:Kdo2-lipid IVA lauroyltransferase/acyltransferase